MRRLVGKPPPHSYFNLLCNRECIVDVDAEIPNSALNLRVAEQELDGPEVTCSSVDHRGFGTPHGMGAVGEGIQPNRAEPRPKQAGVLARRHRPLSIDPARKERLTFLQALLLQPARHSLPGLLRDLELNGPARFPLHDSGSGPHPPIEGHIVDPKRD